MFGMGIGADAFLWFQTSSAVTQYQNQTGLYIVIVGVGYTNAGNLSISKDAANTIIIDYQLVNATVNFSATTPTNVASTFNQPTYSALMLFRRMLLPPAYYVNPENANYVSMVQCTSLQAAVFIL